MPTEFNSVDEFLKYQVGNRAGRLKGWRKNIDENHGAVKVVFHTKQLPVILWQHANIPQIVNRLKDEEEVEELWSGKWNCWEDEGYLKGQRDFDENNKVKDVWPTHCGQCRLQTWLYLEVLKGHIPFYQPLFRFSAADAERDTVLFAGGITGLHPEFKDLDNDTKSLVKESGMELGTAWKQENWAKAVCLFTVAQLDDPGLGIMISEETQLLFQKFQTELRKTIQRKQVDAQAREKGLGNPFRNPYPFRWDYDGKPKSKKISDMYDCTALEEPVPEDVLKLVMGTPPDITKQKLRHNQQEMRAYLEEHQIKGVKIPWDEIYDVPKLVDDKDDAAFPHGANAPAEEKGRTPEVSTVGDRSPTAPDPKAAALAEAKAARSIPTAEDDANFPGAVAECWDDKSGCKTWMWSDAHTCPNPKCGRIWDPEKAAAAKAAEEAKKAAEQPAQEAPRPRGRGRGAKAAETAAPAQEAPPAAAQTTSIPARGKEVGGDKVGF